MLSAFLINNLWRCLTIATKDMLINEQIRVKEVRLIDAAGEQRGVVSLSAAMDLATQAGTDLVMIAPNAAPPVCRIMDYGKYRFEQAKKEKEARKNQKIIELKEIRLSPGIDVNDFNIKVKNATKFLKVGDKVKVSIRFRGRQMAHPEIGVELMGRFLDAISEFGACDKPSKMEGRSMVAVVTSKIKK